MPCSDNLISRQGMHLHIVSREAACGFVSFSFLRDSTMSEWGRELSAALDEVEGA